MVSERICNQRNPNSNCSRTTPPPAAVCPLQNRLGQTWIHPGAATGLPGACKSDTRVIYTRERAITTSCPCTTSCSNWERLVMAWWMFTSCWLVRGWSTRGWLAKALFVVAFEHPSELILSLVTINPHNRAAPGHPEGSPAPDP